MDIVEMLSQAMELPNGKLTKAGALSELAAWDSLAILNFMALVDTNCGITLSPEALLKCDSISDLEALITSGAK
jgi:acyl carrier protein